MPAVVVVGAQWGDEGKGKVVDLLSPYADLVVRYAGGANAGHTLVVGGEKLVLHLIPSGILHEGVRCVIGQGTVIDPTTLNEEIDGVRAQGIDPVGRLLIAERAHVVMPHHKLVDGLREQFRTDTGRQAIGTTKRGIGPCYEDKVGRRGIRIGDLLRPGLEAKVEANLAAWRPFCAKVKGELPSTAEVVAELLEQGEKLRPFVGNGARETAEALAAGKNVLLEGAQGTMLDIDHGTYPFVTSSNAISGGACTGAGVGPAAIGHVVGITKAYTTRVGEGPFPTELDNAAGEALRQAGAEFGATTGRPRRTGWLDIPALRFAVRVNGLTSLALTKLDVLSGLETLELCTGYTLDGELLDEPPFDRLEDVAPVYESLPGFAGDVSGCRSYEELPEKARAYIERISELVGCPVDIVSVGPDRDETIGLADPFASA